MNMTTTWHTGFAHGVARLARDLTGRSADHLIVLLADQLACTARGARLAEMLASGAMSIGEAHEAMRQIEHEGDAARALLVAEVGSVLATPVDAEDLFRVSRSIDDVLDNLRDFVREVDLYHPAGLEFSAPLVHKLAEGIECLGRALTQLIEAPGAMPGETLMTRKAVSQTRRLYQQQLAGLFELPVDNETLKQRELLRRLDVVGLRLGEAADALADGALKRSR